MTYVYDHEGNRKEKTVNGVTSSYMVEDGLVKYERRGNENLWYYYDASGSPVGMSLGNTVKLYFYRKNLQGDVTGIVSGDTGELLVSYRYDAWGKPEITDEAGTSESAELMERNCLLYRGYFYDHETGLYYLQSRYYDPETGRFVNADVIVNTGKHILGTNMFTYCYNNPNAFVDDNGKDAILLLDSKLQGHIGALIQDAEGTWWHFYWGPEGIIGYIACVGLLFVTPETWCEEYDKEISLDNINKYGRYGNGYDEMLWIHGDFSESVEMAKGYQSAYHLLLNNCAQVTLQVLAKSESAYKKELLAIAARHALPTTIFAEVKSIVTRYSLRYRKSGLRDSIQ